MTVDELIARLTEVSKLGHGGYEVESLSENEFRDKDWRFGIGLVNADPVAKTVWLEP